MLAQHLITEPIFDALFGEYSFVKNNVVSKSLNDVISAFKVFGFEKEQEKLKPFYDSIKLRASGIDNAAGKQKLIVTLYDKFFSTGFKDTTEQLGIVFTPVEVVDFIIHSVDDALQKYFGKKLADKDIHILDPFTGTGTFITRILQYLKQQMDDGQITFDDILRKYLHELHANEIVLLSYYIAAINIEAVFDEVNGPDKGYQPFNGIVLTDTFESTERENSFMDELLGENNQRLKAEQDQSITAIISNPPYSIGQRNQNDNNANEHYPKLETQIANTYVKFSKANLSKGTYDSYVKAFRWATDRLTGKGVIGFVTNGSFLDNKSTDGLRASLYQDFNHLYIFNLRGNARTSGEQRRKEKDNVFGQGTRTTITISILIKDGTDDHEIHYHDIGDYLTRKAKLNTIKEFSSINGIDWDKITPDDNNDWLNQRDPNYQNYYPIAPDKSNIPAVFKNNSMGVLSARDSWVVGFNKTKVAKNSKKLIDNYNIEREKLNKNKNYQLNRDTKYIKWTKRLEDQAVRNTPILYNVNNMRLTLYRPFVKKWMYYQPETTERVRLFYKKWGESNKAIVTTGRGINKNFSTLITDTIPDFQSFMNSQGFMRYDNEKHSAELLNTGNNNLNHTVANKIGLSEDDTFAYTYGLLNSQDYQKKYQNDLTKELARIPIVKDKERYVEIGKKLIDMHINYEKMPVYDKVKIDYNGKPNYRVSKMKFAKRRNVNGKVENDRSTIIYNDSITISEIPDKAYQYIVNGRSAIEWIMDQYRVKTDKKSGITDDPNDFSDDPKYIFNLLLRIITVSLKTIDLINQLPKFEVENED